MTARQQLHVTILIAQTAWRWLEDIQGVSSRFLG
jgi:hypothetical protein